MQQSQGEGRAPPSGLPWRVSLLGRSDPQLSCPANSLPVSFCYLCWMQAWRAWAAWGVGVEEGSVAWAVLALGEAAEDSGALGSGAVDSPGGGLLIELCTSALPPSSSRRPQGDCICSRRGGARRMLGRHVSHHATTSWHLASALRAGMASNESLKILKNRDVLQPGVSRRLHGARVFKNPIPRDGRCHA